MSKLAKRSLASDLIERLSGIFDERFYSMQAGESFTRHAGVMHYLEFGEKAGFSPHPLFCPSFVARHIHGHSVGQRNTNIFEDYLVASERGQLPGPHPLFDHECYRQKVGFGLSGKSPLEHYVSLLDRNDEPPSPTILFDRAHFGRVENGTCGLIDYLVEPNNSLRSPHPLFESHDFLGACAKAAIFVPDKASLLLFYVTTKASWVCCTSVLFDPAVFEDSWVTAGNGSMPNLPPLSVFLSLDGAMSCHALFDPRFYRKYAHLKGIVVDEAPIVQHARRRGQQRIATHPFFSTAHYLDTHLDVASSGMDPLRHFILNGLTEGRSPHPLITIGPTGSSVDAAEAMAPDDAYGFMKARADVSISSCFNAKLFDALYPQTDATHRSSLRRFIELWLDRGVVHPVWGTTILERRSAASAPRPVDLVVVSHELTRTGAPLILLSLLRHFTERAGLNCMVLTRCDGTLREAFREWADVVDLSLFATSEAKSAEFVGHFVSAFEDKWRPRMALVNTACAENVGAALSRNGLPVVTLVHELAAAFDRSTFEKIYESSSVVIYPAEFVRREAHTLFNLPIEKTEILPQGLLKPDFGQVDRQSARDDVLKLLDAPENAFLVFGCGSIDLRKGVDLFTSVALATLAIEDAPARPLYFFWAGSGPDNRHSLAWFVEEDVKRAGIGDRLQFIGSTPHTERLYAGSDAFLLTSRQDPFPCVVQEAMACGLPVIAFAGSGGAPEALSDGAGVVVPYGDTRAMSDALLRLAHDPKAAQQIGAVAKERVANAYPFERYGEAVIEACERWTGVGLQRAKAFGSEVAPSVVPQRKRVVFAMERPPSGSRDRELAALLAGLDARGFQSEVIVTGAIDVATTPLPLAVKPRYVANGSLRSRAAEDSRRMLVEALNVAAPGVLVTELDGLALAPQDLPRDIRVLGRADQWHDSSTLPVSLPSSWHGAIVGTDSIRDEVLQRQKIGFCEVVPPAIRVGPAPSRSSSLPLRLVSALGSQTLEGSFRMHANMVARLAGVDCVLTVIADRRSAKIATSLFADAIRERRLVVSQPDDDDSLWGLLFGSEVFIALDEERNSLIGVPEAMCAGLAVINAAGRRTVPPWQRDSGIGEIVARGDVKSVKEAVQRLAADRNKLYDCRLRAQAVAREACIEASEQHDRFAALLDRLFDDIARAGR